MLLLVSFGLKIKFCLVLGRLIWPRLSSISTVTMESSLDLFCNDCKEEHQSESFSRVVAQHQNAQVVCAIQTWLTQSRAILWLSFYMLTYNLERRFTWRCLKVLERKKSSETEKEMLQSMTNPTYISEILDVKDEYLWDKADTVWLMFLSWREVYGHLLHWQPYFFVKNYH